MPDMTEANQFISPYAHPYDRVRNSTPAYVNDRIDRQTEGSVFHYSRQGHDALVSRIAELDHEWDVDRAVMLAFSILGGTAFGLGLARNRRWFYLFGAQMAFLFLHATRGWCPPMAVLRRMGFRTRNEIEAEKRALLFQMQSGERPSEVSAA